MYEPYVIFYLCQSVPQWSVNTENNRNKEIENNYSNNYTQMAASKTKKKHNIKHIAAATQDRQFK